MKRNSRLRLMDVRFCFQTAMDQDGQYRQFFVRVSRRNDQDVVTIDIGGADDGLVEGIDPAFLDRVRAAIDVVRRVKLPTLSEQ